MAAQFPAFQRMTSHNDETAVRKHLTSCLSFRECPPEECEIKNLVVIPEYDIDHDSGLRTRYELHWTSYKGWQTYMWMTGCLATDPQHEN